ncbi:MAG TPA: GIY-YIG nuclease family protein [Phycisphaerae bacterium]|nr:GIY-YIG nuclease family protein [Phycisphaerae bacterium]
MGFFVYILRSERDGSLYVGHTNNLPRRFAQHNDPRSNSYTAKRGPWMLVHSEIHPNRSAASIRERFLKSVAGSREKRRLAADGTRAEQG